MTKSKRSKSSGGKRNKDNLRHNPLADQIIEDIDDEVNAAKKAERRAARLKARRSSKYVDEDEKEGLGEELDDLNENSIKNDKTAKRLRATILEEARAQQAEIEEEDAKAAEASFRAGFKRVVNNDDDDDDDDDDDAEDEGEEEEEVRELVFDDESTYMDEANNMLTAEESRDLAMFDFHDGEGPQKTVNLADLIEQKIRESREKKVAISNKPAPAPGTALHPKVVALYTEIAGFLRRYTSGKLPKGFKIIPSLKNWEEIILLTAPHSWSPAATREATRVFSSANKAMAQRYYNLVLLPKVREDIQSNKRLNFHYYMAVKRAVFKPSSFYKGFLLPLAADFPSVREATIVASVLAKVSIPPLHSAVALLKLSELDYSPTMCIFIKTLLNKKYSLPGSVIESCAEFFARQTDAQDLMPVIWHQTLLVFVQRYKNVITGPQREALKVLLRVQWHDKITEEIRRELFGSNLPKSMMGHDNMNMNMNNNNNNNMNNMMMMTMSNNPNSSLAQAAMPAPFRPQHNAGSWIDPMTGELKIPANQ